jgi:large subunit ribosomal protein L25
VSDKLILALNAREQKGKQNRQLRRDGLVPGVVYGHGDEAQAVSTEAKVLEKVYAEAGGNKIIGLKIDDAHQKNALIHDVQQDVRTGQLIHADFYLVRMDEKIKTEVPLHFIGESTAVYQQEGTLMRPQETVEIEALPADLPESLEVDISVLDDFSKTITAADLQIPADVELLTDPETLIAKVDPPRSDEELEELDEAVGEAVPEGVNDDEPGSVTENDRVVDKKPENKDDTGA